MNLELGQSLALAGLTAASETHGQAGLPGLSQIPILGFLFGSNSEQSSKTENVVFIVPSVIDTVSMQQRSLIDEALADYENTPRLEEARTLPSGRNKPSRSVVHATANQKEQQCVLSASSASDRC